MEVCKSRRIKKKRNFYCDNKLKILGLILYYFVICSLFTSVVGASQDDFHKSNLFMKRNNHNQSSSLPSNKQLHPFLTQFISWLFGMPTSPQQNNSITNITSHVNSLHLEVTPLPPVDFSNGAQETKINSFSTTERDLFLPSTKKIQNRKQNRKSSSQTLSIPSTSKPPSKENNERSERLKRDAYKPIKVPYTKNNQVNNQNFRSNINNDYFSHRQLLLNPLDQQTMLALQQQQAAAATAALLHKHQMDTLLNAANKHYSTFVDDYDDRDEDDEDSDEDSDEFGNFNNFPGPPMIQHHHMYLRNDLPPPPVAPFQQKVGLIGLGRRSVPQFESKRNRKRKRNRNRGKTNKDNGNNEATFQKNNESSFKRADAVSKLKSGQWFLDDYDINSEFYDKPSHQKHLPQYLLEQRQRINLDTPMHLEFDEEEHYDHQNDVKRKLASGSRRSQQNGKHKGDLNSIYQELKDASTTSSTPVPSITIGSISNNSSTVSTLKTSTTSKPTTTTSSSSSIPPYSATLNCRCGTQSVRGEGIGNGTVVRYKVNPWLVEITSNDSHACSGSIINDRYILTSKQCVQNANSSRLSVIAGILSKTPTTFSVELIKMHTKVDIALLKLTSTINPSHVMRPVCLPIGKRYAGQYSTGMLTTFKQGSYPATLQMIDTEIGISSDNKNCQGTGTFCAGPPGSLKCGGDTGGLLMVYRGGYSYEQIGVVSDTVGCRSNYTAGIYTDMRKKTRWVLNNSRDGNYCKSPVVTLDDLTSTTRIFTDDMYYARAGRPMRRGSKHDLDEIISEENDEIMA